MTRKLKVLTLILVTLSIVFGTQVAASLPIARPDVMYPEKSFTLDNPQTLASVRNLVETLDDANVRVTGPYNRYYANTDGTLELRIADYNVFGSNGEKYIISLSLNDDGNVCGTMRHNAENKSYFSEEDHMIIGNEELSYLVTADGKSEIPEFKYIESILNPPPPNAQMISATENAISQASQYLIEHDASYIAQVDFSSSGIQISSPSDRVGSELPLVGMMTKVKYYDEYGELHEYDRISNCYAACTASIIRFREPVLYNGLTSLDVFNTGYDRSLYYDSVTKVDIDLMYDVMMKDYLDNSTTNHYSMAFDITDQPMTQSSFKSIIDNGCVVLGVFRREKTATQTALMHAVALSQYSVSESTGTVTAYGMEPTEYGAIIEIEWINGYMTLTGSWSNCRLRDHITSYY